MIDWCRHSGFNYDQRINVLGYNGMLTMENEQTNLVQRFDVNGVKQAPPLYYFLQRYEKAYENELNAFVDVINGKYGDNYDNYIGLTNHESMKNLNIILEACIESVKSGKAVDIHYHADTKYI